MTRERNLTIYNTNSEAMPLLNLTLWPNRSLKKKYFWTLMLATLSAMTIPLIPFIGTKSLWVFLPFSLGTLFALFLSIILNYQSGKLYENIKIWPDLIEIKRYEVNGTSQEWHSNPYWTKINLYKRSQKIQNYLTLTGSGREVELGAFLSPKERMEIKQKIENVINQIY